MSSGPYRVAMVAACPYPVPQGSQVLVRDTACMLRDRGHDVHLFTYAHGLGECPAGLNVRRSTEVRGAQRTKAGPSLAKPAQDYRLLQMLRKALRQEKFDCVYAHNYEGLAVALAAGHRPIVYHAHNAMSDELPHYFPTRAVPMLFGRSLDRALPKRADTVVALHERLAEYLMECGCTRERVHVVPPSVDVDPDLDRPAPRGLAPVLYTGNLDAYQNLSLLEEAIAHARSKEPSLEWIVATSEAECRLHGATHVHTPDYSSLREILARDAVVACPRASWSGYPIKLLNAMAAGHAVVACESAAFPIRDGVNGCVVPDNDAVAFGDALLSLATGADARRQLGSAAAATARQHFNADIVGSALEQAMTSAIGHASHAGQARRVVSSI